jgi:hypothetical protein
MKALHRLQTFMDLCKEDGSWFHGQIFHDSHTQANRGKKLGVEMSYTAGSEVLTAMNI